MSDIQSTINEIADGLYRANIINQKTLRELTDDELPEIIAYTGEEIQALRKKQHLSQAVFAKYLNVSPSIIRSLEHGTRHAQGAILKLLNIVNKHGIDALI
jgi:putative transcriptional regulator